MDALGWILGNIKQEDIVTENVNLATVDAKKQITKSQKHASKQDNITTNQRLLEN